MERRRHSAEQIVRKLRETAVELARGATGQDACRRLEITEHSYDRWCREYGGLKLDQAKRLQQFRRRTRGSSFDFAAYLFYAYCAGRTALFENKSAKPAELVTWGIDE